MKIENVIMEIEDALSGNLAKAGNVYNLSLNGLKDKALTDALSMLKEQDAVEPRTGHWIEHEGMQGEYYDCSACDYSLMEIHRGMKYCPYCGAKMDNPM